MANEGSNPPILEVWAEIINWSAFMPIVRAEDCRAELILRGKKPKNFITLEDREWDNHKNRTLIPTSLTPRTVRVFAFDTVNHILIEHPEKDRMAPAQVPVGTYDMLLLIDARDTMTTELSLGELRFPDSLIEETESYADWRRNIGVDGYAIFALRTKDNRLVARVLGNLPQKRLNELRAKEFKDFEFEML